MVTVRVFLECASATNRPGGLYDTFIALPEAAFLRGAHLNIACRRAGILGFSSPYRLIEVRRLDRPTIAVQETCTRLDNGTGTYQLRHPDILDQDVEPRPAVTPDAKPPVARAARSAPGVGRR